MAAQKTGFIRVPKTHPKYAQRWYYNPTTGQEITRRAYQTLSHGGIKPEEVARIRKNIAPGVEKKTSRYTGFVKAYKKKMSKKLGVKEKDIRVRGNSPEALLFRERYATLKKMGASKTTDRSAGGPMAKLLEDMAMRSPENDRAVGES